MPKLHHFVPQFHLRRFTEKKGNIWVWERDADGVFKTSSKSVAAEKYFYRLSQYEAQGYDWAAMEKQFSELEGEVALITTEWLDRLLTAEPLTDISIPDINRGIVAQYMALQYLRTSDMRELLAAFSFSKTGKQLSKIDQRELHTDVLWDQVIVDDLTNSFRRCVWVFAKNSTAVPFISSDNPIAFRTF